MPFLGINNYDLRCTQRKQIPTCPEGHALIHAAHGVNNLGSVPKDDIRVRRDTLQAFSR